MSDARLIDANALMEKFGDVSLMLRMDGFLDSVGEAEIISMIGNAPTIKPSIEAEAIKKKAFINGMDKQAKIMRDVYGEPKQKWIPVRWHNITKEEREREGYPKDWLTYLDCEMPQDGQEILVTTRNGNIAFDVCYNDDGFSLDSGWDWIDDILAWMPLPSPYQPKERSE